jgi:hypothetical protein
MQVLRIKFLFAVVLDGLSQSLTCSQLDYHTNVVAFLEYHVREVVKDFRVLSELYEKRR